MMLSAKTWLGAARAAAGYSAPLIPFASFPAALSADGQILRPAEVPRVELMASGGLWLPRGGRQVLQARYANPVTVQNLAEQRAETLGPFPGGLVRAGMQLRLTWAFRMPAIGTGVRRAKASVGAVGHAVAGNDINHVASSVSNLFIKGELQTYLNVRADGNSAHDIPNGANLGSISALTGGYISSPGSAGSWSGDFSQPWEVGLWFQSAAETAVTITGASWSAGVATYTTSANHTLAVGDKDVISGITPSGYNGTFIVSAVGSPTTFSVPLAANPGTYTSGGSSSRISNARSDSYCLELWG